MAILPLSGILQRLRHKQDKLLAQREDKTTSAEIVEPAGILIPLTSRIPPIDIEALKIQAYYQTMGQANIPRVPQPQAFERHAVLHIKGDKSSMLLDFDVQVHMSEDGEFESLIIASADHSVTILRDEFKRRLEEGDMLCGIIYKRIVELKLMDEKDKKQILRGDFLKQGKELFIMQDGKMIKVDQ